jgi:hypothetical protein
MKTLSAAINSANAPRFDLVLGALHDPVNSSLCLITIVASVLDHNHAPAF